MTYTPVRFGLLATSMLLVLVGGCSGKAGASGSRATDAAVGAAIGSGGTGTSATSSASGGRVSTETGGTGTGGNPGFGGTLDRQAAGGSDSSGGASGGNTNTGGRGSGGASVARDAGGVSGTGGLEAGTSDGPIQCEYQGRLFDVGESVALGCIGCVCDASRKMFVCVSNGCGLSGGSGTGGSSGACGDPAVKAAFASCRASTDAASCTERGGLWRAQDPGINSGTCVCPTGEDGCPCAASSDCLGHCAAWKDPFGGCGTAGPFTCTSFGGILGCWCRPEEPSAVCYP
jgi:hypothetical protein